MSHRGLSFRPLLLLAVIFATACGSDECPSARLESLLVSGYRSNQVHRFDLCGVALSDLDDGGRISGAQATAVGPDGLLYVVSEENGRILRYRADTLSFVDTWFDLSENPSALGGIARPVALVFGREGSAYIGGFDSGRVARVSRDGTVDRVYDLAGRGLRGLDAGMTFHPDGRLLVPAYTSGAIYAVDVTTGDISRFAENIEGLSEPRVIVFDADRQQLWVSNEGSGLVLGLGLDGQPTGVSIPLPSATGLTLDNGDLLATNDRNNTVVRYSASGEVKEVVVSPGGAVQGAVFLTVLASP